MNNMEKLAFDEFEVAGQVLDQIKYQTVLKTILAGITPGEIYVDSKKNPNMVFAQFKQRAFISGTPDPDFKVPLENLFDRKVRSHCQKFDVPFFRLTVNDSQWFDIIEESLQPRKPIFVGYLCYQKIIHEKNENSQIPEGFDIMPVNQELLKITFAGKDDLMEEMCSERESVDAFLDKSFGVTAFKDGALAGWCLSEYNYEDQCEVGIATLPPYQRLGLARTMTHHFSNLAFTMGVTKILWHCLETNEPSWRTALSAGFSPVDRHKVLMFYWDPALNLAVHGNINFREQNYQAALMWYEMSLDEVNSRTWMAFNAACAAAHLNQPETAFQYLNIAIDKGFDDLDYLVSSQHLDSLKKHPQWGEVITRINQKLTSQS